MGQNFRKPIGESFGSSQFKSNRLRRNFGRGRGGGGGGPRRGGFGISKSSRIDELMFINKASEKNHILDYVSKHKFSDFKIGELLKQNILKKKFNKPMAIQDQTIPEILRGKDLIGLADTGTGKTAAFLIPFIDKISKDKNQKVLIVAPTRELALQINSEFMDFARGLNIYSVAVVGGAGISEQIYQIRRGLNALIGTPGRLKDLANRKIINLNMFQNVVLDEADRMLDMGFIVDIKFLLKQLPKERQTIFFAATLSKEIENLTKDFSNNPIKIETKIRNTSSNVEQDIIKISPSESKIGILENLLVKEDFKKVLIFAKTKTGVENLADDLRDKGFKVDSIHGDKSQSSRQRSLKSFKENRVEILVATDVAARGLDIPEVTHVINYDIPNTYDDYIHRIGRTGRAHKKGIAITFIGGKSHHYGSRSIGEKPKIFNERKSFRSGYSRKLSRNYK
ncbi:MAG: DEAD/DEAH box helicase [Patescibacteria group bacterium]